MKNPRKILVIIQRSNGDVFLSTTLIKSLFNFYNNPQIDLLVNDDTFSVAKLLPNITQIHQFSYLKKKNSRWTQEKKLLLGIFRKYDLSITYDFYTTTPRLWLTGHSESGQPLKQDEIF